MDLRKKQVLRDMAAKYNADAVLVYNPQWHKENYRFLTGLNFIGPMVATVYYTKSDVVRVFYSSDFDLSFNTGKTANIDSISLLGPSMAEIAETLKKANVKSVALSGLDFLPYAMIASVQKVGCDIVPADGFLERARLIKTQEEIGYLKQAVHLSETAWEVFMESVADGLNEYQIAANVERYLKKNGAEDNFLLMSTGGKEVRGMTPPMNRTAKPGDMVRTEITPQVNGWWAQVCRTCVKGEANEDQLKAFSIFKESTDAGIAAVRPGVNIKDVAKAENDVFRKYGYGDYCSEKFTRGRGHGHGLDLDEMPLVAESSDLILEAGMVIIIHPNTYNPLCGYMVFGDPVEITEDGCKILSTSERKLFEVK